MKIIALITLAFLTTNVWATVPTDAHTFDFNIKTIRIPRFKEKKIDRSVDILREIYASPEFRTRILNHRYKGAKRFWKNRGLTNAQIYRRILSGIEKLHPYNNNAMDVEIELYTDNESLVIGYTNPGTKRIWMNTKYFNRHTPAQVASHLTHEWLHKIGFDHEKARCKEREYSVPYAVGYIVRDLARKYRYYR
jgi:hypothetical protein